MKYPEKNKIKQNKRQITTTNHEPINKLTEKHKNRIKKNLTITTTERKKKKKGYTNLHTITSKLFSLAYSTQKMLSGYCSDDIYKKGLHPLPPWHHN